MVCGCGVTLSSFSSYSSSSSSSYSSYSYSATSSQFPSSVSLAERTRLSFRNGQGFLTEREKEKEKEKEREEERKKLLERIQERMDEAPAGPSLFPLLGFRSTPTNPFRPFPSSLARPLDHPYKSLLAVPFLPC